MSEFRYFWLLCAALWLVFAQINLHRIPRFNAQTPEKTSDRIASWRPFGYFIGAASVVLFLIQLTGGFTPDPLFWRWQSPQRWLALVPVVSCWVAVLWWSLFRGGALLLAEHYSIKPVVAKVLLCALVAFSVATVAYHYQS